MPCITATRSSSVSTSVTERGQCASICVAYTNQYHVLGFQTFFKIFRCTEVLDSARLKSSFKHSCSSVCCLLRLAEGSVCGSKVDLT